MTNRKSHKAFQMTRKSSTSDDLEGSIRDVNRASFGARHENLKEDRRILSAAKNVAHGVYFQGV